MNASRIFSMFARMITRRLTRWGINKGVDHLTRSDGGSARMTTRQAKATRQAIKRARQAARLTRRIGR